MVTQYTVTATINIPDDDSVWDEFNRHNAAGARVGVEEYLSRVIHGKAIVQVLNAAPATEGQS